jgi:hypothetical protein
VIRLQKGQSRSSVLILLFALIILCLLCTAVFARRGDRAAGPLLTMTGQSIAGSITSERSFIGPKLPDFTTLLHTADAGPIPDSDLTSTGSATLELYPSASPGSAQNRIVFCSNGVDADNDGKIDSALPVPADLDLWIMRPDGSEQYRGADLPGDQIEPDYDPSGGLIVFAQQDGGGVYQIYTIQVRDPSVVKQITTGAGNKRHPTYSSDSNWIAFQTDVAGSWDIYKIAATGVGSIVAVTTDGGTNDTDPAWSPTADLIAFTRDNGTNKRIFTVAPDGTGTTAVSNGGGGVPSLTVNDQEPAWNQFGSEVAFASTRLTTLLDANPNFTIWRMAMPGGEVGGATPFRVSDLDIADVRDSVDPAWTVELQRERTRILFTSYRSGNQPDIWAMQLDDWLPPALTALPTVTNRLGTLPGDDVTISVPVFDQDSGVSQVVAIIKDPDQKTYLTNNAASFDSGFTGAGNIRKLELDCTEVGAVILTDDGFGNFSGDWATQPVAHDYIVDIQVWDTLGNTQRYDDIYGFSTKTFQPSNNILFVDDYCEGQAFLSQIAGNNNNHFPAA